MARINIQERWWTDPRREKLITLVGLAVDTVALRLWRCSQEYWKDERSLIPLEIFQLLPYFNELLEAKLAQIDGEFVYAKGSKEHHEWLNEKQKAAAAGGRISALRPRDERGRLTKKSPSTIQADSKQTPTDSSAPPLTPPLTPPLPLTLEPKNICSPSASEFDFEGVYKKYPRKQGKSVGMRKLKSQIKTPARFEDFKKALDRFLEHHSNAGTSQEFYPYFSSFVSQWSDWLDPDVGKSVNEFEENAKKAKLLIFGDDVP